MPMNEHPRVTPSSAAEWRAWLSEHHQGAEAVWLVFHKKHTGRPSPSWSEAVDEALCFAWIDSKVQRIDDERHEQYFCPRRPGSIWSRINRDKVERLSAEGRMAPAGLAAVAAAKKDGSWSLLIPAEEGVIPPELDAAFDALPGSREGFAALSDTNRRLLLVQLILAKRPATKRSRAQKIAGWALSGEVPGM
ncbi:MAG: YdeI/OmpD-associated family protein [Alphaproteobacteria bacterium]|nr:YdeI/OmpD-associated family protein [Alphaproteobacteria bacterium]MCB9792985.1 YdeI/OmpD-associated family protein [Alphaproteobacteria bacterium]